MPVTFNADEVFEIAEKMEANAEEFYKEAAEKASDKPTKKLFQNLAAMENGHQKIFKNLRVQLGAGEKEQTTYDPDNQAVLYLQEMASARGYEGRISPVKKFTGNESIKKIVEIALNSEKEAVVFYYGLRSMVSVKAGKDKIELIINEELSHITALLRNLKSLDR